MHYFNIKSYLVWLNKNEFLQAKVISLRTNHMIIENKSLDQIVEFGKVK